MAPAPNAQPDVTTQGSLIPLQFSPQLRGSFDPELGALWLHWNPQPRPCFNPALLSACYDYAQFLQACGGCITHHQQQYPIHSSILNSDVPGVFNLGGDLALFKQLIADRDRPGLVAYGMACIDVVYQNCIGYGLPLTTVSLVQGECLGGGFEAALSSQVVIAERQARFGFPEVIFNLFPGMGAMSFVLRRANTRIAEELTASGRLFSADDMHQRGLVDVVVNDGEGPDAVRHYLRKQEPAQRSVLQMRRRIRPLRRDELDDIVRLWVDAALRLNPRDLRLMEHIVNRQERLNDHPQREQNP